MSSYVAYVWPEGTKTARCGEESRYSHLNNASPTPLSTTPPMTPHRDSFLLLTPTDLLAMLTGSREDQLPEARDLVSPKPSSPHTFTNPI